MRQERLISKTSMQSKSLCAICRGTKYLCGKSRCPILVRYYSQEKIKPFLNKLVIEGASPPSIFIGRQGYPKVSIGPLVPPVMGDTSFIDTPEQWINHSLDEIVDFRSMLIRGTHLVNIYDVESSDKLVQLTRELALSKNSVYTEALFYKKPRGRMVFSDEVQPYGPSAPLKKFDIANPKYDHRIEKAFYDSDLKARDALLDLYRNNVEISKIQRAFSVGAFGTKKYRKFVPTRWSITAVDSTIGEYLMSQTKTAEWINEYRVYYLNQYDNRWVILMIPSAWQYELIEAWYPNTTWNPYSSNIAIFNSYEFYKGRNTYAEIGGCYYAARLAVNETLTRDRRQAAVVIMREAHPGYILPIGVWNVRESVRKALSNKPYKFDTLEEALSIIKQKMDIPLERWIRNSAVLKNYLQQKTLEDFLRIT